MEITQAQLDQMIQSSIDKALADKHPGVIPAELTQFKNEVTEFAKQITDGTPVRYDAMSQALNSVIRTKLKLKRINDLPLSKIGEARQTFDQLKNVFQL